MSPILALKPLRAGIAFTRRNTPLCAGTLFMRKNYLRVELGLNSLNVENYELPFGQNSRSSVECRVYCVDWILRLREK